MTCVYDQAGCWPDHPTRAWVVSAWLARKDEGRGTTRAQTQTKAQAQVQAGLGAAEELAFSMYQASGGGSANQDVELL